MALKIENPFSMGERAKNPNRYPRENIYRHPACDTSLFVQTWQGNLLPKSHPPRPSGTMFSQTGKDQGPALAAIDAAGPGGCRATARQSRCGDQSGGRAAPGGATGLAGAVCIVVAVVVASRAQWGRSQGSVRGAEGDLFPYRDPMFIITQLSRTSRNRANNISPSDWPRP